LSTNQSAKKTSAEPKRSAAQPHSRRPLTSERVQAKPSIGRFGCWCGGRCTGAARRIQSRTAATSPKGTPVCIMPKGPGFMPSSTTRLRVAP
jgi:hypothetical protein